MDSIFSLTEALNKAFTQEEGIPEDIRVGIPLPQDKGTFGEMWAGNPDLVDLRMHVAVYPKDAEEGGKTSNMLITDRVSGAESWLQERGLVVADKDVSRWEKMFLRDNPGYIPYLNLKVQKGIRKVTVPTNKSWFDPYEQDVFVVLYNDLKAGMNWLRAVLRGGLYRVTFVMVDGSVRKMVTTLNSEFLQNYYATAKDTALGEDAHKTQEELQARDDAQMVNGQIRVPDLEAPIAQGVFRAINVLEVKNIEKVTESDIDGTFVYYNPNTMCDAVNQVAGREAAANYFTDEITTKYGIKSVDGAELVSEYLTRALSYVHTREKTALALAVGEVFPQIDKSVYLGQGEATAEDLF